MPNCHRCGNTLTAEYDFGRQDTCSKCGIATHSCKNCTYYDPSRYNECAETNADRVVDKEKSNFCDYFKPTVKGSGAAVDPAAQAKSAAEALFKKK